MKKLVFGLFFLFIVGIVVIPLGLLVIGSERTPLCDINSTASYDNIQKARAVVKRIKPENLKKKQISKVSFSEKELGLVLGYVFSYGLKNAPIASDVQLERDHIKTLLTIHLPSNPFGEYFNLAITMAADNNLLKIKQILLGSYEIPGTLVNPIIGVLHSGLMNIELYGAFFTTAENIQDITIGPDQLDITYTWNQDVIDTLHEKGKTAIIPEDHQQRLLVYHNELARVLGTIKSEKPSLGHVLKPMFSLAADRSKKSGKPVPENTALLQVLAVYANGTDLDVFINKDLAAQLKPIQSKALYLRNRGDLSKHFLISAGLAVSTNSQLANLIGVAKEVDDSDGGSGFSFADLAADKAGVKLGESAIKSDEKALLIQQQMAQISGEDDFMPTINNLPEGISKIEFKSTLKEIDSKTYTLIKNEIEIRINGCRLYQ